MTVSLAEYQRIVVRVRINLFDQLVENLHRLGGRTVIAIEKLLDQRVAVLRGIVGELPRHVELQLIEQGAALAIGQIRRCRRCRRCRPRGTFAFRQPPYGRKNPENSGYCSTSRRTTSGNSSRSHSSFGRTFDSAAQASITAGRCLASPGIYIPSVETELDPNIRFELHIGRGKA